MPVVALEAEANVPPSTYGPLNLIEGCTMTNMDKFQEPFERCSAELHKDNAHKMTTGSLIATKNTIDPGDIDLFFDALDAGIVRLFRSGRFDTDDRPTGGRWGLLSRSHGGGWYNAEYLPQIAAYADAVLRLGYPSERVQPELPSSALQLGVTARPHDRRRSQQRRGARRSETL